MDRFYVSTVNVAMFDKNETLTVWSLTKSKQR
jgi:hypothetical protein